MVSPALSTSEMSISNARPQRLSVLEQHALSGDQAERSEGEGFLIHRGIVLKGLPIHTDRGKSSQRDRKVSRRSAAIPVPANGCKGGLCITSQSLTRPVHKAAPNCRP